MHINKSRRNADHYILWSERGQWSHKKFKNWKRSIMTSNVNLSISIEINTHAIQRYNGQMTDESEISHYEWYL